MVATSKATIRCGALEAVCLNQNRHVGYSSTESTIFSRSELRSSLLICQRSADDDISLPNRELLAFFILHTDVGSRSNQPFHNFRVTKIDRSSIKKGCHSVVVNIIHLRSVRQQQLGDFRLIADRCPTQRGDPVIIHFVWICSLCQQQFNNRLITECRVEKRTL